MVKLPHLVQCEKHGTQGGYRKRGRMLKNDQEDRFSTSH